MMDTRGGANDRAISMAADGLDRLTATAIKGCNAINAGECLKQ